MLLPVENIDKLTLNLHILFRTLKLRAHFEIWERENYREGKSQNFQRSSFSKFRGFIKRNKKLAADKKKDYIQFAQIAGKIINVKEQQHISPEKLAMIQEELNNTLSVSFRKWLQSKIQAMQENLSL